MRLKPRFSSAFSSPKSRKRRYLAAVALLSSVALTATQASSEAFDLGPTAKYIISFGPSAQGSIESKVTDLGGKIGLKFKYALDGFVAELPVELVPLIRNIPNVLFVEADATVSTLGISNTQSPTPSWGLDRVDQRSKVELPGSVSAFGYQSAGSGSTIYIGDTGIYPHSDFGNRLSTLGFSNVNDGNGTVDCNGHGTHVASTAAGTEYGIAKNATLVPVRVLGCNGSGSWSSVIEGLDWILSPQNLNSKTQAVLNLSLGGSASSSLNSAIKRVTDAGISVVVAAGNDNADACLSSPASAPSALTVGATDKTDAKASFSNYGSCVDIQAPGVGIKGAWIGSPTATNTISGTSMASPHVTGAVAVYLGQIPNATVSQVTQFIDSESTKGVITGIPALTANKLLYVAPTDLFQQAPITLRDIAIAVPVKDATPIRSISSNGQFSASVSWQGSPTKFASNTIYTATITVLPDFGYTLTGVSSNFFRVNGNAVTGPNSENSGVFTHQFPAATEKIIQTITFTQPSAMTISSSDQVLVATSSAGPSFPVSFSTSTNSICTVTSGAIKAVAAGTCSITASQAGDRTTAAANNVTKTLSITKNPQTITFTQPSAMTISSSDQVLVATSSAGPSFPVSFSTSTSGVCSVVTGAIHVLAAGTCIITASQIGDLITAAAINVSKSITVMQPQAALVIENSNLSVIAKGGRGITLSTSGGSGNGAISFNVTGDGCSYSSNTKVLTVSKTYQPAIAVSCSVTANKATSGTYLQTSSLPKIFTFN